MTTDLMMRRIAAMLPPTHRGYYGDEVEEAAVK
jgi:hypothetical protein